MYLLEKYNVMFFVLTGTLVAVELLITFPILVHSQRLIARNICKLFSSNPGISHLNKACCIDELGYKILKTFGFGLPQFS